MNNRAGHFLKDDIAAFDASFFSISPAEAISIDPMQRMLLEVVYEALENGGIPLHKLAGTKTGCFVGSFTTDYYQTLNRDLEIIPKYSATGIRQAVLSNRVSYYFDLKGPSITLDTACSSSLVAVHLACQSIRSGESKMAIVGATNAIFSPDIQIEMTNLHFLSPDSTCYTFDERANGYARGEGVAALILKPLQDALSDGDTIRAVIRGTAVNSDGNTSGITLPSKDAQISLIRSAYSVAGCEMSATGYIEAHGTGTPAGDPLEMSAIGATLGQSQYEDGKLWIGSVKPNIGHLEGASGLAGLIKATLSVEKGVIAPNICFETGNPNIDFEGWRLRIPTEPTLWPVAGLRRASVNSFGYGGTNCHVIVDDAYHYMLLRGLNGKTKAKLLAPTLEPNQITAYSSRNFSRSITPKQMSLVSSCPLAAIAPSPYIFYISANQEKQVEKLASAYASHITAREDPSEVKFLSNLAYTLCQRRSRLEWGIAIIASTKTELIQKLESIPNPTKRSNHDAKIGFVFTGQGA